MLRCIFYLGFILKLWSLHLNIQNLHSQTTNIPIHDSQYLTFINSINKINQQVSYIVRSLKLKDIQKFKNIASNYDNINIAIQLLKKSLQKYSLYISNNDQMCPKITLFNRTYIRQFISHLQNKLYLANKQFDSCNQCQFLRNDTEKLLKMTMEYTSHVNNTLDGKYCSVYLYQKAIGLVNLKNSLFKINLNAKKWYYGTITKSEYKISMFKKSTIYNLTDCPLDKPFVKEKQQICFSCPNGTAFNLGTEKCDSCKVGEMISIKSGSCISCLGDTQFVQDEYICRPCQLQKQMAFSQTLGRCQLCKKRKYIDPKSNTCKQINCPLQKPLFNRQTLQCSVCSKGQIVDVNDFSVCIKTNYIGVCPPQKPLYDLNSKSCKECSNNSKYDKNENKCI